MSTQDVTIRFGETGAEQVASGARTAGDAIDRLKGKSVGDFGTGGAAQRLDALAGRMDRFGQRAERFGASWSLRVTAPIVTALGFGVKAFGDFDKSMTNSLSIMSDVGAGLRREMEEVARDTAVKLNMPAREAAEAYYFLASAGLDARQSMAALPQVAAFAKAGMLDMASAASFAANAQSALGLKAKDPAKNLENLTRVTDVLTQAANKADGSINDFSEALTNRAAASMRLLGTDVEDGIAVLEAWAAQGIKGRIAGEQYSIVLRETGRAARENASAWKDLGMSAFDADGKMRPFVDILADLEREFRGKSDRGKADFLADLGFTAEATAPLLQLIGSSKEIREFAKANREASGAVQEVAGRQMKAFNEQMGTARERVSQASQTLGQDLAPTVLTVSRGIAGAVEAFSGLPGPIRKAALAGTVAVAALGPLALIVGNLSKGGAGAIRLFQAMTGLKVPGTGGVIPGGGGLPGGVQKVWVTNPGFGGPGGGVGGTVGRAGRVGAAVPGIGTIGAAGGITAGGALLGGAALIGVGMGLDSLDQRTGFTDNVWGRGGAKARATRMQNDLIKAWREGGPQMEREMARALSGTFISPSKVRKDAEAAVRSFNVAIRDNRGQVQSSAKGMANAAIKELEALPRQSRVLAQDSMLRMAVEMRRKGELPKGAIRELVRAMIARFGELPAQLQRVVDRLDPVYARLARISAAASRGERVNPAGTFAEYATGGWIGGPMGPGAYQGRDTVPIWASHGEVILNPAEQETVGVGRIMAALRQHGGRIGGDGAGFASGGAVSFGSPGSDNWQAGVAGKFGLRWSGTRSASSNAAVGGSRTSRHLVSGGAGDFSGGAGSMMSLARWAYNSGNTPFAEIFYDPWGQWDNGRYSERGIGGHGDHVHLSYGRAFSLTDLGGSGSRSGASGASGSSGPSAAQLTRSKQVIMRQARAMLGGSRAAVDPVEVAQASIAARHRDDSLEDKQIRVRTAAAAARMGITNPENVAARAEAEVLKHRRTEILADVREVKRAKGRLHKALLAIRKRRKKLYQQLGKTPRRQQARLQSLKAAIAATLGEEESLAGEISALVYQASDLQAQAAEFDFDIGQLAMEIANLPNVAVEEAASGVEAGVSPDVQAQLDQSNEAVRVARRSADLSSGYLRTLATTADLAGGGGTLTVNFQSIFPGDPATQAEFARWAVATFEGQGSVPTTQFAVA